MDGELLTLVVTDGDGSQLIFNLDQAKRVSIGRAEDNAVVLPDASVSRHHAELAADGGRWAVRDRDSHNGTFLNGRRVEPQKSVSVSSGACIEIGRYEIRVSVSGESQDPMLVSEETIDSQDAFTVDADEPITGPAELESLEDAVPAARRRLRCLLAIEQANLELLGDEPLDIIYDKVLDLVAQAVRPDRAALFVLDAQDRLVRKAIKGQDGGRPMMVSGSLIERVMQENVAILIPCTSVSQPGITDSLESEGVRCVMAAPLRYQKRTVGLIYADSRTVDASFQEDDLRVLTALANVAAARIELARLLEEERELIRHDHELRAAAAVQRRLLPRKSTPIRGYLVDGFNRPCFEVGGDFFDYLPLGSNRYGIVLADVAGKGLAAALLLMGVQAYTRAYVGLRPGVDGLAGFLNDGMLRYAPRNRFVSYVFFELDSTTNTVRWCNAGHAPPPSIIRANGAIQKLDPGGPPLGIVPDCSFPVLENKMSDGDLLVVCSDGVTDAANSHEEPFGDERLDELLQSMAGHAPREVRQKILDAVADHVQETPNSDDLTVVAIRRDPT